METNTASQGGIHSVPDVFTLNPSFIETGKTREWASRGRTLLVAPSSVDNAFTIAVGGTKPRKPGQDLIKDFFEPDRSIYMVQLYGLPVARFPFIQDAYVIFKEMQLAIKREELASATATTDAIPSASTSASTLAMGSNIGASNDARSAIFSLSRKRLDQVRQVSHQYRDALKRHARHLLAASAGQTTDANVIELTFVRVATMILELNELMLLEHTTTEPLAEPLCRWLNEHYPGPDTASIEAMIATMVPQPGEHFWSLLHQCLLRGMMDEAARLLATIRGDSQQQPQLQQICAHLRKMPRRAGLRTEGDFLTQWRGWQEDGRYQLTIIKGSTLPYKHELESILLMLTGDEKQIIKSATNWLEALIGVLVLCRPLAGRSLVGEFATDCVNHHGSLRGKALDQVLLALIQQNATQAVRDCSYVDTWLVAHLADMFNYLNLFDQPSQGYSCNLNEYFLVEYAEQLNNATYWPLAMGYLYWCPVQGRERMEKLITRIPLKHERQVQQLLSVCDEYHLVEQKSTIYRVWARMNFARQRPAQAIAYYSKAGLSSRISTVAGQLLNDYLEHRELINIELIDSLDQEAQKQCDLLAFLSHYRSFHEEYANGDYASAARILAPFFSSGAAPRSFWPILLMDALLLLDGEQVLFTSEETYEMMRCLEELVNANMPAKKRVTIGMDSSMDSLLNQHGKRLRNTTTATTPDVANVDESTGKLNLLTSRLSVVRVALVRNLARAISTNE
ncbi:Nup85 nucleoporin-domain-containing protein [Syncephalis plumigaleata]|nr:Nup85 nucleoporin-domain-containing protein [Syncephalis plumigaleata]